MSINLRRRSPILLSLLVLTLAPVSTAAGDTGGKDQGGTGYIDMPAPTDGSYVLLSAPGSGHNYGLPIEIRFLTVVAKEWHKRHPDLPVIAIGDMSHKDASAFPPHVTHMDGLTADIVTRPTNICDIHYPNADIQVELAELFVAYGARQILFNGDAVVEKVKVAQKHALHDDHYHVVIDPKKVPDDGAPVIVPDASVSDGSTIGSTAIDKDGKGLALSWLVLGSADAPRTYRVWVVEGKTGTGTVWDSGIQKATGAFSVKLPVALETGKLYRWKLELELTSGASAGFDWQTLKTDFVPPGVSLSEEDAGTIKTCPVLTWEFAKQGGEQASYLIELSEVVGKKADLTIGPIVAKDHNFILRATQLKRGTRYHWRVRVRDSHGNESASPWATFKTALEYEFKPPAASTKAAIKLLDGDGNVVAKLKKGAAVLVVAESEDRLIVLTSDSKQGFAKRSDIDIP